MTERDDYQRKLGHRRWRTVRDRVRRRDGGICQLAHAGPCKGPLDVHHWVPVRAGGESYDLENLVLVCRRHNALLDQEFRQRWRRRSSRDW